MTDTTQAQSEALRERLMALGFRQNEDWLERAAGSESAECIHADTLAALTQQAQVAAEPVGYVYGNSYWESTNPRLTDHIRQHGEPRYAQPSQPEAQAVVHVWHEGKPYEATLGRRLSHAEYVEGAEAHAPAAAGQSITKEEIDAIVPWGRVREGFYNVTGYTRSDLHAAIHAVLAAMQREPEDDFEVRAKSPEEIDALLREKARALAQQPAPSAEARQSDDVDVFLRNLIEACEDTEAKFAEPKNDFERGRAFEAKGIRRAMCNWFQDTFCGRSFMGEPALATQQTKAAADVLAERHRQVSVEGWTPQHDDEHGAGTLAQAGACYAMWAVDVDKLPNWVPPAWPWDDEWWKPTDTRRALVKAGALILAEIERLDRATTTSAGGDK
jgi:hypothetical protein